MNPSNAVGPPASSENAPAAPPPPSSSENGAPAPSARRSRRRRNRRRHRSGTPTKDRGSSPAAERAAKARSRSPRAPLRESKHPQGGGEGNRRERSVSPRARQSSRRSRSRSPPDRKGRRSPDRYSSSSSAVKRSSMMPMQNQQSTGERCRDFDRGECTRGRQCKYRHILSTREPERDRERGREDPVIINKNPNEACRWWIFSGAREGELCRRGLACPYAHDRRLIPVCQNEALGKCRRGDKCCYRHVLPAAPPVPPAPPLPLGAPFTSLDALPSATIAPRSE
jgi:hypothetical protein